MGDDAVEFWKRYPEKMQEVRRAYKKGPCPICNGFKAVKPVNYRLIACACVLVEREAAAAQVYRTISQVPDRDRGNTFENMKVWGDTKWLQMAAAITSLQALTKSHHNHPWIKITGSPGSGKSHALIAAYNKIPHLSVYIQAGALADRLHKGLDRDAPHPDGWLDLSDLKEHLVEVPVLFLDDLGQEHDTQFINSTVTDIFVRRYPYGTERPTVVTTNLRAEDMAKRYPRLEDRLEDRGLVLSYNVVLGSYRSSQKEALSNGGKAK